MFDWFTNAACPTGNRSSVPFPALIPPHDGTPLPPTMGDCTAVNPSTGHKFDLSSLADAGDKSVQGADGHTYLLHICDKLSDSKYLNMLKNQSAKGAIGAAQMSADKRYFSAGRYSKALTFVHDNVLKLVYGGGDVCHTTYRRTTVVTFVCNKTGSGPKFQFESEECAYNFQWKTPLACERQVSVFSLSHETWRIETEKRSP